MRRKLKSTRTVAPEAKYNSELLAKFINVVMWDGKKSVARTVVYDALDEIKKRDPESEPLTVFETAIANVSPSIETRSRRVGGANYQVPREVNANRRRALAFRWIIGAARAGKGRPMAVKLADELVAAAKGEGSAMKKKDDVHRMAESNRAFAHLAW
jgi:small subunit ribosomal protein S7